MDSDHEAQSGESGKGPPPWTDKELADFRAVLAKKTAPQVVEAIMIGIDAVSAETTGSAHRLNQLTKLAVGELFVFLAAALELAGAENFVAHGVALYQEQNV